MPLKIIQPDDTTPNRHGLIGIWGLSLLLHGVFVFMLLSMKIHSPSNQVILSSIIPVSLIKERSTPTQPVSVKKDKNIFKLKMVTKKLKLSARGVKKKK